MSRRILPAVAMVLVAVLFWTLTRTEPLSFEPWAPAPILRTVAGGPATAGAPIALIGLGDAGPLAEAPPANVCSALFDGSAASDVPVAFFTDHYCPNCRSMAATLSDTPGITVTRHELPILGPDSVVAARAALAAHLQGAGEAFHRRLRRSAFAPTVSYLRDVAAGMDLDADRLLVEMNGAQVAETLERELALAGSLGFSVVPTTVVGTTVVIGDISPSRLARIVEAEHRAGPPCDGVWSRGRAAIGSTG